MQLTSVKRSFVWSHAAEVAFCQLNTVLQCTCASTPRPSTGVCGGGGCRRFWSWGHPLSVLSSGPEALSLHLFSPGASTPLREITTWGKGNSLRLFLPSRSGDIGLKVQYTLLLFGLTIGTSFISVQPAGLILARLGGLCIMDGSTSPSPTDQAPGTSSLIHCFANLQPPLWTLSLLQI